MRQFTTLALVCSLTVPLWPSIQLSAQDTIAPLVVDSDGKPICGEWPEMLLDSSTDEVIFTGSDKYGQKLKVVVDGQSWRLILMAGAVESKKGCEIMAGDGFIAR